jgi:hypothetical protein
MILILYQLLSIILLLGTGVLERVFFISNGRYTDCLSLTYATNKSKKKLKLCYKYYVKREKNKEKKPPFKVNIKVLMISSSHKDGNREGTKSFFHYFCPGVPVSLTFCPIRLMESKFPIK